MVAYNIYHLVVTNELALEVPFICFYAIRSSLVLC